MSSRKTSEVAASQLVAERPDWFSERTLEPIHQVNLRYFDFLMRCANAKHQSGPGLELIPAELLCSLQKTTATTRQRAAQSLFLMADLNFQCTAWWENERKARPSGDLPRAAAAPRKLAVEVAQATLLLAWHTARSNAHAARLLVGLHPGVAEIVGNLSPADLMLTASRHAACLRPRWHDRVPLWQRLWCVAREGSQAAWRDFHIEALQQVASDLDGSRLVLRRNKTG